MLRTEEEHARLTLSGELGVKFRLYDDGSKPSMPDLLSSDGTHVAEVITTAPSDVRKEEQHLDPVAEPRLPHLRVGDDPVHKVGRCHKRRAQQDQGGCRPVDCGRRL